MAASIFVNNNKLTEFLNQMMDGHVGYHLGAKVEPLSKDPKAVNQVDCSGFVRYLVYKVCNLVITSGGTWWQNEWCKSHLQSEANYKCAGQRDGVIRIGYFPKPSGLAAGHIWLILNGMTIESHGHTGPDRRAWNTSVLVTHVKNTYVLGPTFNIYLDPEISAPAYAYV
jgi:hypothetical protein